jgi:hypothetical protein
MTDTKLPFTAQMTCSGRFAGQLILALITLLLPTPGYIRCSQAFSPFYLLYTSCDIFRDHLIASKVTVDQKMAKKKTKQRKSNELPGGPLTPEISPKIDYHRPSSS